MSGSAWSPSPSSSPYSGFSVRGSGSADNAARLASLAASSPSLDVRARPAFASRTHSPRFPRSSPLFESKEPAAELMSSLTMPTASPSGTGSGSGSAAAVSELAMQTLAERIERVEAVQRRQHQTAEDDREWTRSAVQGLTAHIDEALLRLQSEIKAAQAAATAKQVELSSDVDARLVKSRAEQVKVNDEHHQYFMQLHVEQREQAVDQSARLEDQIRALGHELTSQIEQVAEHAGDACQSVSECNAKFVDICVGLDDKIRHTQEELEGHISSAAQALAAELNALESRTEAHAAELEQRLAAATADLASKSDSDLADAEARASLALQHATEETTEKLNATDQELQRVENALVASVTEVDERVSVEADRLVTRIETRHEEHAAAESEIGRRLESEASELDTRIQFTLRKVAGLEKRADDFALGAEVKTQRMLTEMRMDEFSAAAQQLQTHLEEMQEVVDSCAESVSEVSVEVATMEVALLSM
jgi:hypothetical protein